MSSTHPDPRPVEPSGDPTLSGEHTDLLQQSRTRAAAVRAAVHTGTDPAAALAELVRYLQQELLQTSRRRGMAAVPPRPA